MKIHNNFQRFSTISSPILIALLILSVFSCQKKEHAEAQRPQRILTVVSILPHADITQHIGGSLIDVLVLVDEGQSPHNYEPSPRQMAELSKAAVWFLSGTDFEIALVPKIKAQYPNLLIIDGTEGVKFRYLEAHAHGDEDEEHEAEEQQEYTEGANIDRHTWLGCENIKIFATHVADALTALAPEHAATFATNLADYTEQTNHLFDELRLSLKPLYGTKAFVYHPAFGYFLDEFGIEQFAVETGGKEPTAKTLNSLIELAKQERPSVLFVQTQFPVAAAKTVARAAGARVVPLDSLAPNLLENIKQMGQELYKAIR